MSRLDDIVSRGRYQSYAYAYPHKTAYRPLEPRTLAEVWQGEPDHALFLYAHVPFCTMRCGFCNLFTEAKPEASAARRYLDALERQVEATRAAIPTARFARAAIGGGTPTFLDARELSRLFDLLDRLRGTSAIPTAVETSPDTADPERLALLAERGTTRISIGVQSFLEDETRALGRPQKSDEARRALRAIRAIGVPTLNVDLIYGIAGQTPSSLRRSIDEALEFAPEELYLYPLYVRPLTGLGRSKKRWDDERAELYGAGRAHLIARGYTQISMRMFARAATPLLEPPYSCQADGMVGLGIGARSYTRALHYSFDYAVARSRIVTLIDAWCERRDFEDVDHGFVLDGDEQRRRWAIQSLLTSEGLDLSRYAERFGTSAPSDLSVLLEIEGRGWARERDGVLVLSEEGLGYSDVIGPALASDEVERLSAEWELR